MTEISITPNCAKRWAIEHPEGIATGDKFTCGQPVGQAICSAEVEIALASHISAIPLFHGIPGTSAPTQFLDVYLHAELAPDATCALAEQSIIKA